MNNQDPRFPHKSLIIGIVFVLLGGLLLLWRLNLLPSLGALWPLSLILIGLYFLYRVFLQNRTRRYILPGMIFTLGGIFFLLKNTVMPGMSLARIWPAFMLITGLSILPYGFSKRKNTRIAIVIPALAIIGLSIIFFPFSLRLTEERFTDFVLTWWPTLFLLSGVILILSYFLRKKT
jgi:uncharacterized membrane protein